MRKLLCLSAFIGLLTLGCETQDYSTLIKNSSSKSVSYTYNGKNDTLPADKSLVYHVKAYTKPPQKIAVPGGPLSVIMRYADDGGYEFVDAERIELHGINRTQTEVTITADSYLDDDGSTELTIPAGGETTTAGIYTANPNFKTLTDYPVSINWKITDTIMYVTIN